MKQLEQDVEREVKKRRLNWKNIARAAAIASLLGLLGLMLCNKGCSCGGKGDGGGSKSGKVSAHSTQKYSNKAERVKDQYSQSKQESAEGAGQKQVYEVHQAKKQPENDNLKRQSYSISKENT